MEKKYMYMYGIPKQPFCGCLICENNQNLIGKTVVKKSNKPFQNKEKKAIIKSISTMEIYCGYPNKNKLKIVDAVYLENCEDKVRLSILKIID